MMWLSLIILIYLTSSTECIPNCCPGENVLEGGRCSTDDKISFECDGHKVPVSDLDEINHELVSDGTMINRENNNEVEYCQTYPDSNASDYIYILCVKHTDGDAFDYHRTMVGAILGYVSIFFIILTIIVYLMIPKLLDLQGICMIHALAGLASGFTFMGIIQLAGYLEESTCAAVAFLTYFSFTYMIFWMDLLSFHIWRITVRPKFSNCTSRWGLVYHIFGTVGPLICLTVLLSAHYSQLEMWDNIRPNIGRPFCWFETKRKTMIYFYAPFTILLCFNIVFYVWTVVVLWGQVGSTTNRISKYRLNLCVKLFFIMGITWVFEIISAAVDNGSLSLYSKIFFFLLDLCNILKGFLIFLILVVFRKRVRRALANKNICNIKFPSSWRYMEDDEMDSVEERMNCTVVEYKENDVDLKR